jgi:PPM family protein phosphatase
MMTIRHRETQPKKPAAVQFACHTDPGRVRARNEDACSLPPPGADLPRLGILLTVADGVGGLTEGQAASRDAVSQLQALYYAPSGLDHPGDRLREAVEAVNALTRLTQRRKGLTSGHLTTLVAVLLIYDQVWVANVGDSRAYLIQFSSKQRRQLTEDHSSHVRLVKAGILTAQDDPGDAKRSITRAIGLADQCQVDIYHYSWEPGDAIVLCSDGLTALPEHEMVDLTFTAPPSLAAKAFVERAIQLDGSDNITAVVARWPFTP